MTAVCNILFGISTAIIALGIFWILNGWFQGMGVPPCTRLMTHWVPPGQLATKMSLWNTSHSIGAGLAIVLCGYIVGMNWAWSGLSAWRWCFLLPAAIALIGALFVWIFIRDTPSSVGLPEMNLSTNKKPEKELTSHEEKVEHRAFLMKHVFLNPVIWVFALGNFFLYTVRFTVLDWGPTMLKEHLGMDIASASWSVAAFEVSGILGMLTAGWLTDRVFRGRAARTCVICMLMVTLCIAGLFAITPETPIIAAIGLLMIAGFFIYGPQALVGIAAANIGTNKAAATAGGFCGLFGYASTIVSGWGIGLLVERTGWNFALGALIVVALTATFIFLLAWRAKPHGYETE
jgi:OPA family glycerol-3-phosphate transporter-like MFS transporter/OPA family sugar phosphate sensor protein UhpC-like MFS transporter